MTIHLSLPWVSWVAIVLGLIFGLIGVKLSREMNGDLGDIVGFYMAACCFLICALFPSLAWVFAR